MGCLNDGRSWQNKKKLINWPLYCHSKQLLGHFEPQHLQPDEQTCIRCRTWSTCSSGIPCTPLTATTSSPSDSAGYSRWAVPRRNLSLATVLRQGCRMPLLPARACMAVRQCCSCMPCLSRWWCHQGTWVRGRERVRLLLIGPWVATILGLRFKKIL